MEFNQSCKQKPLSVCREVFVCLTVAYTHGNAYNKTAMWVTVTTILAVSADAYVAGLLLRQLGKFSILKILYSASFTWLLSTAFVLSFSFVDSSAEVVLKIISASILIIIGAKNLLSVSKPRPMIERRKVWSLSSLALLGISVAIDASVASVSLIIDGASYWIVPLGMLVAHFAFLFLGSTTANYFGFIKIFNKLSGVFLMVLGLSRFL